MELCAPVILVDWCMVVIKLDSEKMFKWSLGFFFVFVLR